MITREQVADLQPGDVVELTDERWAEGTVLRGPVYTDGTGCLSVGHLTLVDSCGGLYLDRPRTSLTVVSRAPRPLYVNHPRTEPVNGDVVRDADDGDADVWLFAREDEHDEYVWCRSDGSTFWWQRHDLPARLRLLVDGETGQVVP